MVWASIEKTRRIHSQESNGDGGAGKKKEVDEGGGDWITSRTTCRRELSGEEAQDRVQWRCLIRIIDPTSKWEKRRKKKIDDLN